MNFGRQLDICVQLTRPPAPEPSQIVPLVCVSVNLVPMVRDDLFLGQPAVVQARDRQTGPCAPIRCRYCAPRSGTVQCTYPPFHGAPAGATGNGLRPLLTPGSVPSAPAPPASPSKPQPGTNKATALAHPPSKRRPGPLKSERQPYAGTLSNQGETHNTTNTRSKQYIEDDTSGRLLSLPVAGRFWSLPDRIRLMWLVGLQ